ncbi:Ig-like domain-containing protein [Metabacillus halosaccharovorans]|uniref:Ig-like domain-containing protein n=1 Tax=Metabacillus halosaccharovorans TaxID=930124 RepID=UPI0037361888
MKRLSKTLLILVSIFTLVFTPLLVKATETEVVIEDPTPDSTGPVLQSLTVSSNEATPDNLVKITAEASDDLSGVREIYVYYKKPSGYTESSYLYLNQTTKKYEGNLQVDTYDEAGEWVLDRVTLYDQKDNSRTIVDLNDTRGYSDKMDFSPYTITVSGVIEKEDTTPPIVNNVNISSQYVKPGETLKVTADVSDDISGVDSVQVTYLKPSGKYRYVYLYLNQTTGKYEGDLKIDQYDELDEWKFYRISAWDNLDNYSYVYDNSASASSGYEKRDFSANHFIVSETTPDLIGPVLDSLAISLEQASSNGAIIKLTAKISDALSGVSYFQAVYQKPSGRSVSIYFGYNSTTGKYEGQLPIDKYDELGLYKLIYINIYDNKDNEKLIYDSSYGSSYALNKQNFEKFHFTVRGVITVPPPGPFSITFSEKQVELTPGQSYQSNLTLNMTDETTKDVTSQSSGTVYTSSNPTVVKIDGNGLISVDPNAEPGEVRIEAENSRLYAEMKVVIPGVDVTPSESLSVSPLKLSLASGQSKQLNVVASLATGDKDVTAGSTGTTYSSTDTAIATVTSNGLITISPEAKQGATVDILIKHNSLESKSTVTVTGPPTVKNLAMTPTNASVLVTRTKGETVQLSVGATMSDGTSKDVTAGTNGTTYKSLDTNRATVDENGLVSILPNALSGSVTIIATNNNIQVKSIIDVTGPPTLESIELESPIPTTLEQEGSHQISAIKANWSDGTQTDVTSEVTYESSVTTRMTVTSTGLIEAVEGASGGSYIYVKYGGKTLTTLVQLKEPPTLTNIELESQIPTTLDQGGSHQISSVKANWSDGTQTDVTSEATYESSVSSRMTVTSTGLIEAVEGATGGTYIYVRYGGKVLTALVKLEEPPTLTSIELVSPIPSTIEQNGSYQITGVKANWSDGTQTDITSDATYESSVATRMTVTSGGLIEAVDGASGGSYIYVKYGGKTLTTLIQLEEPPTLTSIELESPIPPTLAQGGSHQISSVKANWSDGTQTDVSLEATYESTVTTRMTVTSGGLIEAVDGASGGSYIYVKYGGKTITTLIQLEEPPTLTSIELASPIPPTLAQGGSHQISSVKANWSDGTQTDVSSEATYESSVTTRVTVTSGGLIEAVDGASGGSYIYVKYGGKTITTLVKLEAPPTLTSIELASPISPTLARDGSHQITGVKANWSDGTQTDVTSEATYESSVTTRMTVTSGGLIEAVNGASGSSYIYVKYGGKTLTALVTLETPPTLTSIELSNPIPPTLAQDGSHQITGVKANWSDGTQTDVTSEAIYESSVTTRMTVTSGGLIEAVNGATGGSYIYVKYGGKTLSTLVNLENPPTLLSIELENPIPTTLSPGGSHQISNVKANWSDGSQTDVTSQAIFVSSVPSRMTVTSTGLIEAVDGATGGSYIYVKYGGKTLTSLVRL